MPPPAQMPHAFIIIYAILAIIALIIIWFAMVRPILVSRKFSKLLAAETEPASLTNQLLFQILKTGQVLCALIAFITILTFLGTAL